MLIIEIELHPTVHHPPLSSYLPSNVSHAPPLKLIAPFPLIMIATYIYMNELSPVLLFVCIWF